MKLKNIALSIALTLTAATSFAGQVTSKINDTKELVIGSRVSAAPFSAVIPGAEENKHQGYSVDICNALAQKYENKYKTKLNIKYSDVTSSNRFSMLDAGNIDIECAGTSVKPEQAKIADFAVMYSDSIIAAGLNGTTVKSLEDLKTKRIAITAGFSGEPLIREFFAKNGIEVTTTNLQSALNYDAAFMLLKQKRVDVIVTNRSLLIGEINKQADKQNYTLIDGAKFKEKDLLAILLPAKDKELSDFFKEEVRKMLNDGTLNTFHVKHFGNPMPSEMKKEIAEYYTK
ncbi:MAG: transporter substrate-binding domain-containing protein [Alphaproteobacteria bacterium]|nr:transporter substrate-binding domain-containing protein [Alphaproteobacteria bacterium]